MKSLVQINTGDSVKQNIKVFMVLNYCLIVVILTLNNNFCSSTTNFRMLSIKYLCVK